MILQYEKKIASNVNFDPPQLAQNNARLKENNRRKLIKKGFINYQIKKQNYIKDIQYISIFTNKSRLNRLWFIARHFSYWYLIIYGSKSFFYSK